MVKSCGISNLYVEVSHHEIREVEPCQLEQQFVLAYGIGIIHEQEGELRIAFVRESLGIRSVLVRHYSCSAVPYILHAEIASHKGTALAYSVDNHTCKFADLALRICLYEGVKSGKTTVGIAFIELAESGDEQELIPIVAHWETLVGYARVLLHLLEAVVLEGLVCGCIERVLEMSAILRIVFEIRVGENGCPLGFSTLVLQSV